MEFAIRRLTVADLDVTEPILDAAYGPAPDRQARLRRDFHLQPDGWRLAVLHGQPVGMGGATDFGRLAYIGLLAVLPHAQRRGIGQAIMQDLLAWLDARGCPIVALDASAAGAPLYPRLGFVEDDRSLRYQRVAPTRVPAPHRIDRITAADLPALAAFDAPIFGAWRLRVFQALLADYPERGFVRRDISGGITGYLFAQPRAIGPWAARKAEAAEALLQAALALPFADAPTVTFPSSNPVAPGLLRHYGFAPQRDLSHMRRGGSGVPGTPSVLYGRASFTIG
jgi:GNAT superfamily N-acetyltransferase